MSLPDGAEYWWKDYPKRKNFLKVKYPKHDCKPRGGVKGSPFRNKCKVCGRGFSRKEQELINHPSTKGAEHE